MCRLILVYIQVGSGPRAELLLSRINTTQSPSGLRQGRDRLDRAQTHHARTPPPPPPVVPAAQRPERGGSTSSSWRVTVQAAAESKASGRERARGTSETHERQGDCGANRGVTRAGRRQDTRLVQHSSTHTLARTFFAELLSMVFLGARDCDTTT